MSKTQEESRPTIENYLKGKGILPKKEGGAPKHQTEEYKEYTRNRIYAAQELLRIGKEGEQLSDEETQTAERNQHRALENVNRLLGGKLEHERYEPDPQPGNESGPQVNLS